MDKLRSISPIVWILTILLVLLASCSSPPVQEEEGSLAGALSNSPYRVIYHTGELQTNLPLSFYQGDTQVLLLSFQQNASGNWSGVNITGSSVNFTMHSPEWNSTPELVIAGNITNSTTGNFTITINSSSSSNLAVKTHYYRMVLTLNDSTKYTISRGRVLVR